VALTKSRPSERAVHRQVARPGRLGLSLALIALWFQLLASALHSPSVSLSVEAELAGLFAAHALCIAADGSQPGSRAPEKQAPQQPDHDFAACCPWHGNPGPCVPTTAIAELIAFDDAGISFLKPAAVGITAHLPGTVRARSPPIDA
jgi:hypothetical protein